MVMLSCHNTTIYPISYTPLPIPPYPSLLIPLTTRTIIYRNSIKPNRNPNIPSSSFSSNNTHPCRYPHRRRIYHRKLWLCTILFGS